MSKRITLTEKDIELIVVAISYLHEKSIINPEAYPQYALASKQRMEQLKNKLGINNE